MQSATKSKAPSQRQLRVGEELRHAISEVLRRGELHHPDIDNASVIVSEVRVSPDLKNATVYVAPLAGLNAEEMMIALNDYAPNIRRMMNKKVVLKYSPKLYFKLDTSFDEAYRINNLLNSPSVKRDLAVHDDALTDDMQES